MKKITLFLILLFHISNGNAHTEENFKSWLNEFKLVIFDLSIKEYGRSHNKSFIFSIFFFRKYFLVLVPTPFMVFISESKKLETLIYYLYNHVIK